MNRIAMLMYVFLLIALSSGCGKRESIEELSARLTRAGIEVAEPDYGPLSGVIKDAEDGMNLAQPFGDDRPSMKTVTLDGVLTTIYRFESNRAAERFFEASGKIPDSQPGLPERMKKLLGRPKLIVHKNFVLRLNEGLNGRNDSETITRIQQALAE